MKKSSLSKNKRLEAINTLLKRENMTRDKLASMIYVKSRKTGELVSMEPQNLSRKLNPEKEVDEKLCVQISKLFPQYNLEWLLGTSDIMLKSDFGKFAENVHDRIADGIWGMIEACLIKKDMSMRFVKPEGEHFHADDRYLFPTFFPPEKQPYFSIVKKDGKEFRKVTTEDLLKFESEIQAYVEFMTERHLLCEKYNDSHFYR